MRNDTPRAICLNLLNQVEETDRHLDHLLNDSFKRYRHLTPLDRSFLTELTYGILRWKGKLDWTIRYYSTLPFEKIELEILNLLRLGCYQILFLSKTPDPAAVNESVKLAKQIRGKGGGGFVNAILRSIQREKAEIPYPDIRQDPVHSIAIIHSHPLWLIRRWVKEMGIEETLRICRFNNQISTLTLRTNTLKIRKEDLIEQFDKQELRAIPTRFSEDGILLKDPPPTSKLPFFNQGIYLIQDEASQLVTFILNPEPGERILDACAAPGGKTTHMAQKMENRGEIHAMDLSQRKLKLIKGISHKMGVSIIKTVEGGAANPLPVLERFQFDRILADVPCSGFGTLRRNPDLKWRRKEEDIQRLSELQYSILKNLSSYLKKGGILVYSTCTVFQEENEGVVEKFLNQHPQFQLDRIDPILPRACHPFIQKGYFTTFPPKNGMDGFFAARLVKANRP